MLETANMYLRCRSCEMIALTGEIYCFSCGVRLVRICDNCGREQFHLIANYCPHCGVGADGAERNSPCSRNE
jgi:hypothetical protein